MKKTININLGGYAFTIDEDAYEYLEAYVESLKRKFKNAEGHAEILSDIEARMGELITANLGTRSVVQLFDIQSIVDIMGKPEDFDEELSESTEQPNNQTKTSFANSQQKRLYRDEDDAVMAGVCSGLTNYFGFPDPIWMRLAFILLTFFSFGFWVTAYLILWVLVPAAKTAADRLAMKGKPVNADNIAEEIQEGFERIGNKVSEFSQSVKKKKWWRR